MKKFLISFLLFITCGVLFAESVSFTASAPSAVAKFQQFRLVYSLNASGDNFEVGNINDFNVLMGPSVSTSYSTQIINGNVSSSKSMTFTYILQATKEGTFTIPASTVMCDGKKYYSNTVTIKVLPADEANNANRNNSSSGNSASNNSNSSSGGSNVTNLSGVSVFMRAIPSKVKIYEQEYTLLTYKLYVKGVNVAGFSSMKFPETKGFLSQEIQLPDDKQFELEHYKGSNYNVLTLKQLLLFPQQSGKITIPSGSFEVVLRVPNTSRSRRSIFDDFFDTYTEQKKTLKTDAITIDVKSLPSGKPSAYANAVGVFNMKSSISSTNVKANEAITIKVNITGNGNLKLVKNPIVNFPADFEVYDPKVTNNFDITKSGVKGTRTIEYLAIPRYAGSFTIPPIEFAYFDLNSNSYRTLRSDTYNIMVEKGSENDNSNVGVSGNITNKEALKMLGSDIHYINTKDHKLNAQNDFFYGSTAYCLWLIIPSLLVVALLVVYRKQLKANADVARTRNRKANKLAVKRLKIAEKHLKANEREKFYDETLKALWGYFANKFNIPIADLTKEKVEAELSQRNISEEKIAEVKDVLSTCEFARYSPTKSEGELQEVYQKTVELISSLEEDIKKN